ncbi:hypothetical protein [Chryseobacterium salviniae]|uniref:Uncharacterized protein n=1 Tax=Chryseobacterium salviniae TaxID=3101750 RepID=A0ABU6HSM8_9FLAO|nr:hypothetical protein [Chryseobacterium sp. T9W2-O]MEC3876079.1 hypothetical protein [Chryseobacterium sp. T9W2-O]
MKKICYKISLICALLFVFMGKAQLDTLSYIKQFEINKSQYINKPFSYLLGQMTQIQPKTVWADAYFKDKKIVKSSTFNFCQKEYSFSRVVTLRIKWENSIPRSDVKYYEDKNHFYFTNEEKAFYGNKIVKDIMVYK